MAMIAFAASLFRRTVLSRLPSHISGEVNAKSSIAGSTALHWAAEKGLADVCMALLSRADFTELNAKDDNGQTALSLAAEKGLGDVCMALLSRSLE